MVMQGSIGEVLIYSSADISSLSDSKDVLCINGARKICVTVIGSGTSATVKLNLALGSSMGLPITDGEIVSNASLTMTNTISGNDCTIVEVMDVDGYSELALVGIETSSTVSGTVYIEGIF